MFAWESGCVGKPERGRPFELSHKGWLAGCHVGDVGERGVDILCRETGNDLRQGRAEMHGLF